MILTRIPKCVSQRARTRPVGPAPMMSTSVSALADAVITHANKRTAKAPKCSQDASKKRNGRSIVDPTESGLQLPKKEPADWRRNPSNGERSRVDSAANRDHAPLFEARMNK